MTPAIRAYLRQIGSRGGQANKGTAKAHERASKAAKARWAKAKEKEQKQWNQQQ
jgi:hypothetical protein